MQHLAAGVESAEPVGEWDAKHKHELDFVEVELEQKKFEAH